MIHIKTQEEHLRTTSHAFSLFLILRYIKNYRLLDGPDFHELKHQLIRLLRPVLHGNAERLTQKFLEDRDMDFMAYSHRNHPASLRRCYVNGESDMNAVAHAFVVNTFIHTKDPHAFDEDLSLFFKENPESPTVMNESQYRFLLNNELSKLFENKFLDEK
jgi:hypothetical protein